jgi:membrane protein DedA with SNARE-associated domain
MEHTTTTIIQHFGYAGLGLGLIISTLGLFSSEAFLLLGGVAVRHHLLGLPGVIVVVLVAQLIGATASHAIGQYGGVPLIERYGRPWLLSKRDLARSHRWFERYGRVATVMAYCLPLVRGYAGYAAGIAKEPRGRFMASALVGSALWSALMIGLGYYLAGQVGTIEGVIGPISYLLAAVVVVAAALFVRHRLQEARP